MSQQQVISYADLSIINSAMRSINSEITGIHTSLSSLDTKQEKLEDELDKLSLAFADFIKQDKKQKALQLAETRVGNLEQELQAQFGFYAEVRRMATGILQGVDTEVVSDSTLKFTTEEVMIKAPGYWLASALVSLASWIRNDQVNSEKALNESLKRDDYKTTLFFMLVMRRLNRYDASLKWFERYFMHQNPYDLDREFIIILQAVTTGVFPPSSRQLMMTNIKSWLDQLSHTDNFINSQKEQWVKFFESKGPLSEGKYPMLEKFASNWGALENSLKEAKTHNVLKSHFGNIFSSSSDFSKAVKVQLDEILSMLVTNFDDEELPLHQQVRLNQLIIQMDGDKAAAQAVMDTEQHILVEKVDFLQLLTNAAFNPQLSGATRATQALAVSISQPWIVEAHDTFTANCRNKIPGTIDLSIEGFKSSTSNGNDEQEQIRKHETYWDNVLQTELAKIPFPTAAVVIGALICLGGIYGITSSPVFGIIGLGIGAVLIGTSINKRNNQRKSVTEQIAERRTKSKEVLRGCIAEAVDYREELGREDSNAEELRRVITSIKPEDFSSVSRETARSMV